MAGRLAWRWRALHQSLNDSVPAEFVFDVQAGTLESTVLSRTIPEYGESWSSELSSADSVGGFEFRSGRPLRQDRLRQRRCRIERLGRVHDTDNESVSTTFADKHRKTLRGEATVTDGRKIGGISDAAHRRVIKVVIDQQP